MFYLDTGIEILILHIVHFDIFDDPPFSPQNFRRPLFVVINFEGNFLQGGTLKYEYSLITCFIERINDDKIADFL